MSCLYACAYVWAGVCGCVWLRLIRSSWESSPLGYISSCHALPLVRSLQFAVDAYEAFLVPGFRDSWALLLSWTPIAGDSSAHCFPALPASAPTESSVSAYGKLRFCLRKAPRLPTEAPPLCLREAPFSFSLCITSCNKLSFSATESSRLHCDMYDVINGIIPFMSTSLEEHAHTSTRGAFPMPQCKLLINPHITMHCCGNELASHDCFADRVASLSSLGHC